MLTPKSFLLVLKLIEYDQHDMYLKYLSSDTLKAKIFESQIS